ncbi:MAG: CHAT domain-containing protein [Komarekiella atlantica HA4396-MV6]|jgi:hypothetical protein|nr:CHAT domain-containing protein [Komarekiella atlantica HA4396-MV6]
MRNILFLAANPSQTARLDLAREFREIEQALRCSKHRDHFTLHQKWAVTTTDLRRALLDCQPDIVHFSGHGAGKHGLILEDETGGEQLVIGDALAGLFGMFSKPRECVILNACYSEFQAEAIVQNVDYVVGMDDSIEDSAAIKFAVGFYDGLAGFQPGFCAGSPIEFAFNFARNALQFSPTQHYQTPKLKKNRKIILEEWESSRAFEKVKALGNEAIPFKQALLEEIKSNRFYKNTKPFEDKAIPFKPIVIEEELECTRLYKAVEAFKNEAIPFELAIAEIEKER